MDLDKLDPSIVETVPLEYHNVLTELQIEKGIRIKIIEEIIRGLSGAKLYHVDVYDVNSKASGHYILKLDKKKDWYGPNDSEISRHLDALEESPKPFADVNLAKLPWHKIDSNNKILMIYEIAGGSLDHIYPLSDFEHQHQDELERAFSHVTSMILKEWNVNTGIKENSLQHPYDIIEKWVGWVYKHKTIYEFLSKDCKVDPNKFGCFNVNNLKEITIPNAFLFCKDRNLWEGGRKITPLRGFLHNDLNLSNILLKLESEKITAYLIDLSSFDKDNFLLYDNAYLELAYLLGQTTITPKDLLSLFSSLTSFSSLTPDEIKIYRKNTP